jgi:hypothetical protein
VALELRALRGDRGARFYTRSVQGEFGVTGGIFRQCISLSALFSGSCKRGALKGITVAMKAPRKDAASLRVSATGPNGGLAKSASRDDLHQADASRVCHADGNPDIRDPEARSVRRQKLDWWPHHVGRRDRCRSAPVGCCFFHALMVTARGPVVGRI